MKKSIGIDLGTTNSVVAIKTTAVKIIQNKENEELTRSCVGLLGEEILVGTPAYQLLTRDPVNTILSIKRLMGGAIKDRMVQDMLHNSYYRYAITSLKSGTDDAVAVVLGGKQLTPEQISAEILKKLKNDAEEKLGDEITHAVITVPAYFTEKQKNATRVAAKLAGLKVQQLLAEPTAAAIAYGVDNVKAGDSKTVMIYDFGGGTFDLSILNIVDNQYMEVGTIGDRWLGGDDIDKALQAYILKKISIQYAIPNINKLLSNLPDKKRYSIEGKLRDNTEKAKIQLSSAKSTQVFVEGLKDENGDEIDFDIIITRDEYENIILPFIERSIELIGVLLKEVNYGITMIDNILLVGGTSCIPLVKKMLSEKFGPNKIKISEKPMLAIAEGAAILSHRLCDDYEIAIDSEASIGEISYSANHNYYIEITEEGDTVNKKIINKQTPLPIEVSRIFSTTTNFQKIAKVRILSDVEDGKFENQAIGFYLIDDYLPIGTDLIFEFTLDINENFSVNVAPRGKKNLNKKIVLSRGQSDQKALRTIDELIEKTVKEYKTADGENIFLDYISEIIKYIDIIKPEEINDNKWAEIYYKTIEKFDEIKANEQGWTTIDWALHDAKNLISEFGDVLNDYDKKAMTSLIIQIESSIDEIENYKLAELLNEKNRHYGLLNLAQNIESLAKRILNIPGTPVGVTSKQSDVSRLTQLWGDAKAKILMHQMDSAGIIINEAYEIILKYKQSL